MRFNVAPGRANRLACMALVLTVAGCASQDQSSGETAVVACPETRPQVCTLEYAPTCGIDADGQRLGFASPCNACATEGIVGYEPGSCPE